jgi:O-antigen/teichoic acid export membrane protein
MGSTVLSVLSTIIISRTLGPAGFGVLAVYTSLVQMLLGFTDFGLGTTAIKLISANLEHRRRYASVVMKVIFKIEIFSGLLVGVVGLALAGPIANLLGGPQLLFVVQLAFFASIFSSAGAFIGPFFVAYQQFTKNALFGVGASLAKLAGVLMLFKYASVSLDNTIYLYVGIAVAMFFIGLYFSPRDYLVKATKADEKQAFNEIFHFSKWILLSYFATVLAGKLDVFLLLRFKGSADVGLYAAAQQLTQIMPLMIGAFTTVLLPRVSRMTRRVEFVSYTKKVLFGSAVLCLALLPVLLFGDFFIHLIFGNKYSGSIMSFKILFVAYLAALFANPLSLVLYAINQPKFMTYFNYASLAISVVLNVALIPVLGIVGASITFLVGNVLGLVVVGGYTLRQINRQPE